MCVNVLDVNQTLLPVQPSWLAIASFAGCIGRADGVSVGYAIDGSAQVAVLRAVGLTARCAAGRA